MLTFILNYWIEFFFGIFISILIFIYHKIENHFKTIISSKNSIKILLKNEIIKEYRSIVNKKFITIYEKEIIMDLYKEYKNLDGNGIIDDILNDIDRIPLKENYGG